MEVKTRFGTLEATISEGTKGVYISVSGGMDSATLMYMLCCQIREKKLNIPVYCGHCSYPYDPCSLYHGSLVVKHMRREFPDINIYQRFWVSNDDVGKRKGQLLEGLYKEIREENKWSVDEFRCWWGLTANPDDTFTFIEPDGWYVPQDDDRTPGQHKAVGQRRKPLYGVGVCHPFRDINKKVLVDAQWILGLFPCFNTITNSCTSVTEYQCHKCWWCQERKWAIDAVIPANWRCPPNATPIEFYGGGHTILKKWREGIVWSLDGWEKREKIEKKFPIHEWINSFWFNNSPL